MTGLLLVPLVAGLVVLREATLTEPDQLVPGTATRVVFDVEHRRRPATADDVRTLWAVCREALSAAQRAAQVETSEPGRGEVVVSPALGSHQERRVRGCLEDLTLDRRLGEIVELATAGD
jgi:hypothetical protein